MASAEADKFLCDWQVGGFAQKVELYPTLEKTYRQ